MAGDDTFTVYFIEVYDADADDRRGASSQFGDELYETAEQAQDEVDRLNAEDDRFEREHNFASRHRAWERQVLEFDALAGAGLRDPKDRPAEPVFKPLNRFSVGEMSVIRAPTCNALIHHGPGHQSRSECERRGRHDTHAVNLGGCRILEWEGPTASTGAGDESPL